MAGELFALRTQLDRPSARLLDECEAVLTEAGVIDLLLERIHLVVTRGLVQVEVQASDGGPVQVCTLGPYAELLLREYLAIARRDWSKVRQRQAMLDVALVSGFGL